MDRRTTVVLKMDEIACCVVNCFRRTKNLFANKKRYLKNNTILKDNEKDLCFILGNGPSINKVDLGKIQDYDSFTVNHFYLGEKNFESTYHVVIDPAFGRIENHCAYKHIINKTKKTKIIAHIDFMKVINTYEEKIKKRVNYIYPLYVPTGKDPKIDICKPITGSLNIVPVVIECAISMGYKKIYLIGCDFNFYVNRGGLYDHFYQQVEKQDGEKKANYEAIRSLFSCSLVQKQHYDINKFAIKKGVEIINLSEGSLIEAYPIHNYDKEIKKIKSNLKRTTQKSSKQGN